MADVSGKTAGELSNGGFPKQAISNAQNFVEYMEIVRSELTIFRHDSYGEMAPAVRLLYVHLPEMARRMGAKIDPDDGHPKGVIVSDRDLADLIAKDAIESRKIVGWLHSRNHKVAAELMAKGEANIVSAMLERFSIKSGFARRDALEQEQRALESGLRPQISNARLAAVVTRAHSRA